MGQGEPADAAPSAAFQGEMPQEHTLARVRPRDSWRALLSGSAKSLSKRLIGGRNQIFR